MTVEAEKETLTVSLPEMKPDVELTILRQKYPDGLLCTSPLACSHRLIATTAAGWAKSSEADRLAYRDTFICTDCRQAAEERERVREVRRANALAALAVARQKRHEKPDVGEPVDDRETASSTRMNSEDSARVSVTARPVGPRRGGRPKKHLDDLARRRAAADRAVEYRLKKKQTTIAANDALLAGAA